jgi:mono/diheme cytochrome c family protein
MRRPVVLALAVLAVVAGFAVAGCGGEEEATPTPETMTGTIETTDTTETDTTETETTETTDTTETETTETTDTGGGGGGTGDPAAGKEVFIANCGTCHTLSDAGTSGDVGPNLDDAQPPESLVVDRVTNGAGQMPPFKDSLSEQQIADVAAYVSSVAGS